MKYQGRFCSLKRREQKNPETWKVNPLKVLSSETKKGQPGGGRESLKEMYQENRAKEFLVIRCGEL